MGIFVFDLDQTVIDSSHRTPKKDGEIDLVKYLSLQTRENIYKDKILPLASLMKNKFETDYVIVCTARKMTKDDYDFLRDHNLNFHEIYERGNVDYEVAKLSDGEYKMKCLKEYKGIKYTFYDDSEEIIDKFKLYENVEMIDSKIENERMQNLSDGFKFDFHHQIIM